MTVTMQDLSTIYRKGIEEDLALARREAENVRKELGNTPGPYAGETIDFLFMPKIFSAEAVNFLGQVSTMLYGILTKIIHSYREEPALRRQFSFPPLLEKWLLLPPQYATPLPLLRADLFFNEEDFSFSFCEFNADGASAMNKDRKIFEAIAKTTAFTSMAQNFFLQPFELFDSWVTAFMNNYNASANPKPHPFIAIVDFLESGVGAEFAVFKAAFQQRGYEAEICEIRDLRHRNGALYTPKGQKIDAIYRRAVTGEVYTKAEEAIDFLTAVHHSDVVLIGPLSTQIIHHKILFSLITEGSILSFLNETERQFVKKHFPFTTRLNHTAPVEKICREKDQWIIKPQDLYGSKGVYAGLDHSQKTWADLVHGELNKDYLAQHYVPPFVTENLDFSNGDAWQKYNNLTGLYIYNGKMCGIYSRAGKKGVISSLHQGRTMASLQAIPPKFTGK